MIRSLLQQFPRWFPFISRAVFRTTAACVCDSYAFARPNAPAACRVRAEQADLLFPFSLSPRLSLSRVRHTADHLSSLFAFPSVCVSNHPSTCSPPSFLLSQPTSLALPPPLSLFSFSLFHSVSLFLSLESSTLQSGAATYTTRWIPSPVDSLARARRGTEQNRARTALGQRQRI